MYGGYNTLYCVYGSVSGTTLSFQEDGKTIKLPIKQHFLNKKTGFIQFIREANGVCKVLRIVEHELPNGS